MDGEVDQQRGCGREKHSLPGAILKGSKQAVFVRVQLQVLHVGENLIKGTCHFDLTFSFTHDLLLI